MNKISIEYKDHSLDIIDSVNEVLADHGLKFVHIEVDEDCDESDNDNYELLFIGKKYCE